MAERLSGGNVGVALLCNSLATGAMLVVLIAIFGPVSGAHLNPAVTLAFLIRRSITTGAAAAYVACQLVGGVLGTWAAHLMFGEAIFQVSTKARTEPGMLVAEALATFGLVLTIFGTLRWKAEAVPLTVGLYITSAYWFTSSTSFANPAVTLPARLPTPSRASIRQASQRLCWLSLLGQSRQRPFPHGCFRCHLDLHAPHRIPAVKALGVEIGQF